jgi:hypothetical protein
MKIDLERERKSLIGQWTGQGLYVSSPKAAQTFGVSPQLL